MISAAHPPASPRAHVNPLWTAWLLGGLLFIPGLLGYLIKDLSFATGTIVMLTTTLALVIAGQLPFSGQDAKAALLLVVVITFAIVSHLIMAYIIDQDPNFSIIRALSSIAILGYILFCVPIITTTIMDPRQKISPIIKTMCFIFILICVFSIMRIQPPSPSTGEKPTFPFTEPSFLGLSMPAFLIFALLRSSVLMRVATIASFLVLGYAMSNLTVIAVCVLAGIATLPFYWIISGGTLLIVSLASLNLTYYTERLNFDWSASTNLSSLVYVQGWQMLAESLERTYGWGIGFQQLGMIYTNVPASYRINALLGYDLNLQDGGFVLAKLGAEFGIFGLILSGVYFIFAAGNFLRLRKVVSGSLKIDDAELFSRCCIVGYVIELMVRGTNYFTGTFVFLLSGALYLARQHATKRKYHE